MTQKPSRLFLFIIPFLCILVILTLRHREETPLPESNTTPFEDFTNSVFLNMLRFDNASLHQLIEDYDRFNLTQYSTAFGTFSGYEEADELRANNELLSALHDFDYAGLSLEEQICYDVLEYELTLSNELAPYYYYYEPLSVTSGYHSYLPVLLCEYRLNTVQDVEDYLSLLSSVPALFEDILAFEEIKIKKNLFMSDEKLDMVLKQCRAVLDGAGSHVLQDVFSAALETIPMTMDTRVNYILRQEQLIENSFYPSYETLMLYLAEYYGYGEESALCSLPNGQEYYQLLVKEQTGSEKNVPEIQAELQKNLTRLITDISTLVMAYPQLTEELANISYPANAETILSALEEKMAQDFPQVPANHCTVKPFPKAVEGGMNPAMYLFSAVDNIYENTIYVNEQTVEPSALFHTLAHEGYPGHMLQYVFFGQNNRLYLRNILTCPGYSEGWATYCEIFSFRYMDGISEELQQLLSLNLELSQTIFCLMDIFVNYNGMPRAEFHEYFSMWFGEYDLTEMNRYYEYLTAEPASYLAYGYGYLQISELYNAQKQRLGTAFDIKDFHTRFLKIGSAPFSIVEKYLDVI